MSLAGMPRRLTEPTRQRHSCIYYSHHTQQTISHGMDHTRGRIADGTEMKTGTLTHRDDWKRHTGLVIYRHTHTAQHRTQQNRQHR